MKKLIYLSSLLALTACETEEPDCGSTISFTNKTPESLQIKVNGSIPSGCGFVSPGGKCTTAISPDVTFTYEAKGSDNNRWAGSDAVPKCTDKNISLTY
ncbi:hypothetical protein ACAW74_15595 [Fibrella sp. WM1]|uniref:hypothetical protein n=1 Tax=Fibrella musci TaxID=3242485 RepID=UPI0035206BED